MMRALGAIVAMTLAAALSGCAEAGRGPWERAATPAPLALEVHNNNFLDVTVYALADGSRSRLGSVTGKCTSTLAIPESVADHPGGFRLLVDPVGSPETYVTDAIYANSGAIVVLEVGSALSMSSWHLRQ